MNGKEMKACIFGAFVLIAYGIYVAGNPTADGIIFATIMAMLAGIGGYAVRGALDNGSGSARPR